MKKYTIFGVVILLVFFTVTYQHVIISNLKQKNITLVNNTKAYEASIKQYRDAYNQEHTKVLQYQINEYEWERSGDSLIRVLREAQKQSNIKDKQLLEAGVVITQLKAKLEGKPDTIKIVGKDTLKCATLTKQDFILEDICYSDSIITSDIVVNNTQSILFSSKKETVNPERKFFLRRWLQRKQILCEIEVVNSNPYIHTVNTKFVKFIK